MLCRRFSGLWFVDEGLWSVDEGLWSVDEGLWSVDEGLWSVDEALWSVDEALWSVYEALWSVYEGLFIVFFRFQYNLHFRKTICDCAAWESMLASCKILAKVIFDAESRLAWIMTQNWHTSLDWYKFEPCEIWKFFQLATVIVIPASCVRAAL